MKFKLADIPWKGRGLVATSDIEKNELVLKERRVCRGVKGLVMCGSIQKFLHQKIPDEDKQAVLALNDPDPTGPEPEKMIRIYQNNVFADGLFLTCARMNHSCKPAVQMSSDDEVETEVRALRAIKTGEEITVSYLRTFPSRQGGQSG